MAKARVTTNKKIRLTLSEKEASALYAITRRISGSMEKSPREHTDSIGRAIRELINYDLVLRKKYYDTDALASGYISFQESA